MAIPPKAFLNPTGKGFRISDGFGSGVFGALRDGGTRKHLGVDVLVESGQEVIAPFDALVMREAIAYPGDSLKGIVLRGLGSWMGWELKMLYLAPFPDLIRKHVAAGTAIGLAQTLQSRYPGISDHIHVQLSRGGVVFDPTPFLKGRGNGSELLDHGVGESRIG